MTTKKYIVTSINVSAPSSVEKIDQWLNDNASKGFRLAATAVGTNNGVDHMLLVMANDAVTPATASAEKDEKKS